MELRIRPKSDYLHQASWEGLYLLTEHWKSDMEFYRDELRFLNNLVSKYFIWLIKDKNIANVQILNNKLSKASNQQKEIIKKIDKHLMHLEELMENAFSHNEQQFRDEHEKLENEFSVFIKSFRELKKETFTITEDVIEVENIPHLLPK